MYAIRNKKINKWVYGTDYRYWPHHQRTSEDMALTWDDYECAAYEFKHRQCGKQYEIVPVRLEGL